MDEPHTAGWQPDVLGLNYQQRTLSLGEDPDGEPTVVATLVRHAPKSEPWPAQTIGAVLYVHGFTDYFFQEHLAEHFAARGYRFYALDLRKCGRSWRAGQTPHYVSDLRLYDAELNESLRIIRRETQQPVLLLGHSTGGLVLSLWLDRLHRTQGAPEAGVSGLVLNSPWFDLPTPWYVRALGIPLLHILGRFRAKDAVPLPVSSVYGESLHSSQAGEWEYDLAWKPLTGFSKPYGVLRAIRRGQARLHAGLAVGTPALVLCSDTTTFARKYSAAADVSDTVLDVRHIQRWSGCLGDRTLIVPITGARHDVFLSTPRPRAQAFTELDQWLTWLTQDRSPLAGTEHDFRG